MATDKATVTAIRVEPGASPTLVELPDASAGELGKAIQEAVGSHLEMLRIAQFGDGWCLTGVVQEGNPVFKGKLSTSTFIVVRERTDPEDFECHDATERDLEILTVWVEALA